MSTEKRKQFLEVVTGNQQIILHVKLFRMPLFLTILDEELQKYDDSVWDQESTARETAARVMPGTLLQFGIPQEEIDRVIDQCMTEFLNNRSA